MKYAVIYLHGHCLAFDIFLPFPLYLMHISFPQGVHSVLWRDVCLWQVVSSMLSRLSTRRDWQPEVSPETVACALCMACKPDLTTGSIVELWACLQLALRTYVAEQMWWFYQSLSSISENCAHNCALSGVSCYSTLVSDSWLSSMRRM